VPVRDARGLPHGGEVEKTTSRVLVKVHNFESTETTFVRYPSKGGDKEERSEFPLELERRWPGYKLQGEEREVLKKRGK